MPAPRTNTIHLWECSDALPMRFLPIWKAIVPYEIGTQGALVARAICSSAMPFYFRGRALSLLVLEADF